MLVIKNLLFVLQLSSQWYMIVFSDILIMNHDQVQFGSYAVYTSMVKNNLLSNERSSADSLSGKGVQ